MNRYRRKAGGYTILEVMIVLTISTLLFASAVSAYTLQNHRTEFTNSVNNFAQDIQDTLNDVETGFYPSSGNFSCSASASGGAPSIDYTGSAAQGTNATCIFVGKAVQFFPQGTNRSTANIYTVVGRSMVGGTTDPVANINDAKPVGLDNLVDSKFLTNGAQILSVRLADGTSLSGLAMISTSSSSGGISTGLNARTNLAAIAGNLNEPKSTFFLRIKLFLNSGSVGQAKNGINICLREGAAGGRTAVIGLAAGESQSIIVNTNVDQPCT